MFCQYLQCNDGPTTFAGAFQKRFEKSQQWVRPVPVLQLAQVTVTIVLPPPLRYNSEVRFTHIFDPPQVTSSVRVDGEKMTASKHCLYLLWNVVLGEVGGLHYTIPLEAVGRA